MQAEIFKSDFEEERRDRTRAHGELEVLRIKGGQTKAYRKQVSALQIDIDKTRRERNQMKTKLATVEAKSKTEYYDLKKNIFKSKTEIEKLTRERDSYREQCAKKKEIQADLTKSKNVVEKCRKSIEVLTHKTHVLKEEKKFLSEEIKGLDEQVQYYFIISPSLHCMHNECLYYCMLARDCPDLYNRYGGEVGKV